MMQMNNPLMQIGRMMASGATPQQMLATLVQGNPQMMQSGPQLMQAMQMMQGKTPQQLEQIARNMARERGTTVEDVARSLGLSNMSNR